MVTLCLRIKIVKFYGEYQSCAKVRFFSLPCCFLHTKISVMQECQFFLCIGMFMHLHSLRPYIWCILCLVTR